MFFAKQHKFLDEQFSLLFEETTCSCCFSAYTHVPVHSPHSLAHLLREGRAEVTWCPHTQRKWRELSVHYRYHASRGFHRLRALSPLHFFNLFSSKSLFARNVDWGSAEQLVNTKIWMNTRITIEDYGNRILKNKISKFILLSSTLILLYPTKIFF